MQIPTSVWRFTLISLRYFFACDLSFTFCDFDTVALLIINTVLAHHTLTLTSDAWSRDVQYCNVAGSTADMFIIR